MNNKDVKIGDIVTWESQARASWKVKEGRVMAIIPPYTDARNYLSEDIKESRCRFDGRSQNERLLVRVMGGAKGNLEYYYAPRISAVSLKRNEKENV